MTGKTLKNDNLESKLLFFGGLHFKKMKAVKLKVILQKHTVSHLI